MIILKFLLSFIPWNLSAVLFSNYDYYKVINKPVFALPSSFFGPIWIILYILIAISITILFMHNYMRCEREYKKALIANYITNQTYLFFAFSIQNLFLGFIDSLLILITSLYLYYETKKLNMRAAYFLIPYCIFNVYASILSLSIYILNI